LRTGANLRRAADVSITIRNRIAQGGIQPVLPQPVLQNVDEEHTHWPTLVAGTLALSADGFDLAIIPFLLPYIERAFQVSLATASFLLLATTATRWIGALLFGSLASRHGRKPLLIAAVTTIGVFTVLSGLAPSFAVLLVFRLLFGLGVGGVYAAAGALIREGAGRRGGLCSGIMIVGWFGGSTLSPLFFYAFLPRYGWRGVFLSEGIVLVLIPYLIFGLRESRIWLASRTAALQHQTAHSVSFRSIADRPFWRLFTPGFLGTTLMLVCLEYGNFFSSSSGGLLPTFLKGAHLGVGEISTIGAMSSFAAMPGSLTGGWLCDNLGRKRTFILIFAVIWVPVAVTIAYPTFPTAVTGWTIFGFFNGALGGSLAVFETEQYPTDLRSPGYGFAHNLGALGGAFGAIIAAALAAYINLGPALILMTLFGVCLGMIAMLFAKETAGRSLLTGQVLAASAGPGAADSLGDRERASGSRRP
jgi:MFS transporter, SHS family, lactate transporter